LKQTNQILKPTLQAILTTSETWTLATCFGTGLGGDFLGTTLVSLAKESDHIKIVREL
jgi:hypothetical protein